MNKESRHAGTANSGEPMPKFQPRNGAKAVASKPISEMILDRLEPQDLESLDDLTLIQISSHLVEALQGSRNSSRLGNAICKSWHKLATPHLIESTVLESMSTKDLL